MCKLFADHRKLYGITDDGANKIQMELHSIEEWSRTSQLPFNASKCKVLHFGNHNHGQDYTLDNQQLKSSDTEKDLGIIIDTNLKFHIQTAAAVKKANQVLGILKKTYCTRDAQTIACLYKAMVRPHLEYGNTIWGPFYKGDIKLVESVQRRATKIIPELRDKPYEERRG